VAGYAQTATAQIKDIRIPKIQAPPKLEQFLDGTGRSDMKRIDDFRQRSPGDGVPVSQKTAAFLGYDDKNLYAVFVCEAPQLRARLSRREDIFSDDMVGIFLDTFHDRQRNYEFLVNAYGIQADALLTEGQGDDFSFDTLWYSEGRITPTGYVALLSLPFRSLRFTASLAQTWGLALGRFIPTNNEASFWPFITLKVSGFTPQLGTATGLEGISPGRNLQLVPYAAFGRSHFLDNPDPGVPSFRSKTDFRAGLDAKAVIRDSLTLDLTLNPDFSQVESDDPQVTVNQRFEVYFPEKRPFFLENSAYFSTPENLFFSRRIVDPEFGARLTGKLGRWNLGLLTADDRAPGAAAESGAPQRGKRAAIGVARVQREFGKQSNIGMFLSGREFAESYSRVAALDTRLKFGDNWTINGQAMASLTRTLEGERSGGNAYNANLFYGSRKWIYELVYNDRSEGFHTDLGFVPRTDMRQGQQFVMRRFRPKNKALLVWGPNLYSNINFDHRGVQQDWRISPGINLEFARSTYIGANHGESYERFDGINFRRSDTNIGGHSEYFKWVTFDGGYSFGTRINYGPPGVMRPFLGASSDINAQITIRPMARLKLDQIYYYTKLKTRDARPTTVFVDHLVRSRLNYQFTRELSMRVILDYNGSLPNHTLIDNERRKRITGDVLLTYLIHPGTAFYVGYTERLENLAIFPGPPPVVGRIASPSARTGRLFFAKLSYLFRF
jgi:hypothetical protein